jgi:hypothetical protein
VVRALEGGLRSLQGAVGGDAGFGVDGGGHVYGDSMVVVMGST